MVFIIISNNWKTIIVITIERGIAKTEMKVVLIFQRNKKITIITSNAPSLSASITLLIAVSIKSACLKISESSIIPGGKVFLISSNFSRIFSVNLIVFV